MNAIITVVGSDKVGIISKVSSFLAEHKINIEDITQTILSGNFVMMMMVTLDNSDITIDVLRQLTILDGISDNLKQTAKDAIKLINVEPINVD